MTVNTLLELSELRLRTWFIASYIISEAKTGICSHALKLRLTVDLCTVWLTRQKLLRALCKDHSRYALKGCAPFNADNLDGEWPIGSGRRSAIKVLIVAAVSLNNASRSAYLIVTAVGGFTTEAIRSWAKVGLSPSCDVRSDALPCSAGVSDAACIHSSVVLGQKKPSDPPQFIVFNAILGNLKSKIKRVRKNFNFANYTNRFLGAFAYRLNRGFDSPKLMDGLFRAVTRAAPLNEHSIKRWG
jgi:ISXO2-like transposase domain